VPIDEYARTLEELVLAIKPQVKGLVLMTPFFIEANPADAMRARMDEYGRAVLALARKIGAVGVDVQAAFDTTLKHLHSSQLAWDRIHPGPVGHMVIARAFLDAVGFVWSPVRRERA
jgi:lysophospholipase L1-like esterase